MGLISALASPLYYLYDPCTCGKPITHAFSDAVSGVFRWARREADRGQNQPDRAPGNASVLPASAMPSMSFVHPAFGTRPTFYMLLAVPIQGPDDIPSSPLGQHILDYEPPRGFVIPAFSMFNGSIDPHDHILHYDQAMILNAGNNPLLCKVFPVSLRGPALAWFQKLPLNSINLFNDLWVAFISQYFCSVLQKRNISSLQFILKKELESI